ncbi:MAG TPA: hypothetical protein VFQ41_12080 [Candidatus Angelobacter sp.]|nr:hypothetical protein [Candidatus Angelobacter sp.]
MRDIRNRLYNAAERFDRFLDDVWQRVSPRTKTVLVFMIGGLAAVAAWTGKYLVACILLGCGAALWLSR